jgi:peptidyl-dipeptidase Dcp
MKTRYLAPLAIAIALAGCQPNTTPPDVVKIEQAENTVNNPFFSEYATPHGIPPFDKIKKSDYLPAFNHGIAQKKLEIEAITKVKSLPTFENTIVAMEKSGNFLTKVSNTFYGLIGSMSDEEMRAIAKEMSPKLSALADDIALNHALFVRVKEVYDNQMTFDLRTDQKRLLETTYKSFVRGGANLNDVDKLTLRDLNETLSGLSLNFGENLLAETNNFEMVIDNKADLDGLPADIIAAASETATARGHKGKWVFTTHRPSKNPFLTYVKPSIKDIPCVVITTMPITTKPLLVKWLACVIKRRSY